MPHSITHFPLVFSSTRLENVKSNDITTRTYDSCLVRKIEARASLLDLGLKNMAGTDAKFRIKKTQGCRTLSFMITDVLFVIITNVLHSFSA